MIDQHNSLAEKFIKKGFWLYLFSFIIAPMGYIIKIIISGELSVSEVGILYGIISLITILSAYNDLGLNESINYFIPKFITEKRYDKVKTILVYTLIAQLSTGLIIACFFFFGADWLALNYFKSSEAIGVLKVFAFFYLGINIFQILTTFYGAIQNTFYNKLVEFFRMIFSLIVILSIFLLNLSSLLYFSYAWIIGLYIGVLISVLIFYKSYFSKYLSVEKILWDKSLFKKIFKYALMVFLGAQAGSILGQIDMQMIIYLLGTNDAGYYTNYLSIIGIPFMIIGPIFGLLFPVFSEMYSKGENKKIKIIKSVFQKNFLAIGIALNILMFIFAESIAFILFGEKFITSGVILKYSILLLVFNFLLQINFNIMAGVGKVKERVKIIFIAVIFNIFTNLIFIKFIGVSGAALASGMGWILIYILSEYFLGKDFRVSLDYKFLGKNIIVMGTVGIPLYLYSEQIFNGLGRGTSFWVMLLIGILWFSIFSLLNLKEIKLFIGEIKKIKR